MLSMKLSAFVMLLLGFVLMYLADKSLVKSFKTYLSHHVGILGSCFVLLLIGLLQLLPFLKKQTVVGDDVPLLLCILVGLAAIAFTGLELRDKVVKANSNGSEDGASLVRFGTGLILLQIGLVFLLLPENI